jgi:hypothetical protein
MIRATFECETQDDLVEWAKDLLQEFGYIVRKPEPLHDWETPSEFSKRIELNPRTFSRKIRLPDCPADFGSLRGKTGRVIRLRASKALELFMLENKTQNGS